MITMYTSKSGREFLIRKPHNADAEAIISFSKTIFASTDQVLTTPEEYTITKEGEEAWIRSFALNSSTLCLVAELDQKIVGLLFFLPQPKKKTAHVGEFGVSVHPDFHRLGIGRALIQSLLKWAEEQVQIQKIFLQVFETNQQAINLYKSLGFIEEGRFPGAIRQPDGSYVDVIQMYVHVRPQR
jgi:RimJ/RimL family protein N-acetyltransferase